MTNMILFQACTTQARFYHSSDRVRIALPRSRSGSISEVEGEPIGMPIPSSQMSPYGSLHTCQNKDAWV